MTRKERKDRLKTLFKRKDDIERSVNSTFQLFDTEICNDQHLIEYKQILSELVELL